MGVKAFRRYTLGVAGFVALVGVARSASASVSPGTAKATSALAFDPFAKTASSAGASGQTLVVSNGSAAMSAPAVVRATDSSNQPLPGTTITIQDAAVVEGNSGTTPITFLVTLSKPSPVPVLVNYTTVSGSAVSGSDFQSKSGTVTFPAGSQQQPITIQVVNNTVNEPTETFSVTLSNGRPSPVTIARATATGTIFDNDSAQSQLTLTLAVNGSTTVLEGPKGSTTYKGFSIYLSGTPSKDVMFNYTTVDGTAKVSDNDYGARYGKQTFAKGTTSLVRGFQVPIIGDEKKEGLETFKATIFNPVNATIQNGSVTITIDDIND
ncbi:MAG: hypothetical protein JWO31_3690 [Phycisphaerales bacterium]|nr:hypothetical protein [Phycisphaerales bacterium]